MDMLVEIFVKDEFSCLDIGANKSSMMFIKALEDSGLVHLLDMVVIPVLDGEQDAVNASAIYTLLKDLNSDLKFLFVLNRAKDMENYKYQFENYFGDTRGVFKNIYPMVDNLFEEDKESYVLLKDDDIIKYSRRFGLTIYEIAKMEKDFILEDFP
jgi:hypothetical protein